MIETAGKCKRTHYSREITTELNGEDVIIKGWIHEIRDLGGIVFVLLRDRDGILQITAPSKKITPELFKQIQHLKKESVISVKGTVKESPK
ncbi:MAG TPA: OB-fold nucleic acid binding domain-containing protein, partial [Methanobacterium sp.]